MPKPSSTSLPPLEPNSSNSKKEVSSEHKPTYDPSEMDIRPISEKSEAEKLSELKRELEARRLQARAQSLLSDTSKASISFNDSKVGGGNPQPLAIPTPGEPREPAKPSSSTLSATSSTRALTSLATLLTFLDSPFHITL